MMSERSEITPDAKGVLRLTNMIFFNEYFFIIPFLLQFVMYKCEETRNQFLAKVHEEEDVMKI